jgi:hypothetical protein
MNIWLATADQHSETFSGPTIIVKIGKEEKPYYISKALAMHHSGYFRGAFNSDNFVEGAAGEVSTMVVIQELLCT